MFKKMFSMLIILTILVSSLAGCGGNSNEKQATNKANGEKQTDQKEDKNDYNKKLNLTMWSAQDTDYIASEVPSENVVKDWLTKQTNVEIENIFGNGGGSLDAKLTQLLAADNLPHLLRTNSLTYLSEVDEADKLWKLTPEMLQKYAPNVWENIPDFIWESAKVDGKIMGIPFSLPVDKSIDSDLPEEMYDQFNIPRSDAMFSEYTSVWVRDDILKMIYPDAKSYDELVQLLEEKKEPIGDEIMDVPITTPQEYIDFFYKIKELNIKEGNRPVYPFGFNGGDNWMALAFFGADLMGYKHHTYIGSWDPINNKVRFNLLEPLFKQTALTENKMIRDKVIEPESLVHTQAQYIEKVKNGLYACAILSYVGEPNVINKELKAAGKEFQFRPLYTQIPNRKEYPPFKTKAGWYNICGILKTVKEEDLPQVLNWINVQFSEEFEDVYFWGPKEAGLYVEKDGKRTFNDDKYNKYFIQEDLSDSKLSDFKGLANSKCTLYIGFMSANKYFPPVYNKCIKYSPSNASGFKFKVTSPHVKDLKYYPPADPGYPKFASIPEVKTFWSTRQQWEDPFKLVFAADSDEDFEVKWKKAEKNIKSLVDLDKMTEEMTKIAKEEAEKLGIELN